MAASHLSCRLRVISGHYDALANDGSFLTASCAQPFCVGGAATARTRSHETTLTPADACYEPRQELSAGSSKRAFFAACLTKLTKCRTTGEGSPRRDARVWGAFGRTEPTR